MHNKVWQEAADRNVQARTFYKSPTISSRKRADIEVVTFAHVVYANKSVEGGYLSEETIHRNIDIINHQYAPAGISFSLKNLSYTENADWALGKDEFAMRLKLRGGGYNDLNLYFVADIPLNPEQDWGVRGICSLPTTRPDPDSLRWTLDGFSLLSRMLPGSNGTTENIDNSTATHEIGHWLGLLHTFEGGCGREGDEILDTVLQAGPTKLCPTGDLPHSCNLLDPDMIKNFMDISTCTRSEFTAGQIARMKDWEDIRRDVSTDKPSPWSESEEGLVKEFCDKRALSASNSCLAARKYCFAKAKADGYDTLESCVDAYKAGKITSEPNTKNVWPKNLVIGCALILPTPAYLQGEIAS
ncbi:Extracellular metalloprotease [Metarhizium anisopliae]|nr:Extracellular metalloprotease [Metarhizium anisopliae]